MENSTTRYYYAESTVALLCSALSTVMVLSILGNCLVIVAIFKNKEMRTRTNILLCNLAISDILVGALDIPFSIIALCKGDWIFSDHLCTFNGFVVGLGLMVSSHTLMWISVHKCITICNPFKKNLTLTHVISMIVAAWGWSLFYNTLTVFGWTDLIYKKGASQCGPTVPQTGLQRSHAAVNNIVNIMTPVAVICFCYVKILVGVRNHLARLSGFSNSGIRRSLLKEKRITVNLLTLVACFFVCYTPYLVYATCLLFMGEEAVSPIFNPLAYLALYSNSAYNPIIYALKFPNFQKAYKNTLFGIKELAKGGNEQRYVLVNSIRNSFKRRRSMPGYKRDDKIEQKRKVAKSKSIATTSSGVAHVPSINISETQESIFGRRSSPHSLHVEEYEKSPSVVLEMKVNRGQNLQKFRRISISQPNIPNLEYDTEINLGLTVDDYFPLKSTSTSFINIAHENSDREMSGRHKKKISPMPSWRCSLEDLSKEWAKLYPSNNEAGIPIKLNSKEPHGCTYFCPSPN